MECPRCARPGGECPVGACAVDAPALLALLQRLRKTGRLGPAGADDVRRLRALVLAGPDEAWEAWARIRLGAVMRRCGDALAR